MQVEEYVGSDVNYRLASILIFTDLPHTMISFRILLFHKKNDTLFVSLVSQKHFL